MNPHNMYKPYPYLAPDEHKRHPSQHGGQKRTKGGHTIEPEGQKVEF